MTSAADVEYRYFLADLLTNEVISEVPFKGVSYGRANRKAGSFSGTIPFVPATRGLDLYEATMPGRTAVYVMRNGICVWGGIIWSRSYDSGNRALQVDGSEFISYFYHRNIWQTIQYGSAFVGVYAYVVGGGVGTVITESPHGFVPGNRVRITYTNPIVDGVHTIISTPSAQEFTFSTTSASTTSPGGTPLQFSTSGAVRNLVDTYDFARDLIYRAATDLGGFNFANEVIKPAKELQAAVIYKERSGNLVTLRTSGPHEAIPGQEMEVVEVDDELDGLQFVHEVPDDVTIRFISEGPDIAPAELPGIRYYNVTTKQLANFTATLGTDRPHEAAPGDVVVVDGVDSFFTGRLDSVFNGRFTVTSVPSPTSFTFSSGGILGVGPAPVAGGVATFGSKVLYGDYGSFIENSDTLVEFENYEQSGFYQDTQVFRGFEQKTVGEILESYSNTVDGGFEYRIDCDYDYATSSFTRTLKLIQIELPFDPPSGGVYSVSDLGADRVVFEYPGNISTFTVDESAEEAATRFFVVGRIEDLTDAASQPYAGASAKDLLYNDRGRNWPLLDQSETLDEIEDELSLYGYARDYLYESRPPMGVISVTVNGSIDPVVGTYYPGQWCSLLVNDDFVRARLANDQELRDDVLVRKINSYKVTVSDNPVFPETVDLELVTDWKVDKIGN